ncbi:MAG: pilus assembly protein TadG-related protein [Acidobacteriota bacterium]
MPKHQNERGYTLVVVAACLFLFLGFAGLAVDVSIASSARTQAQRAADAAALAGAFTFINTPTATQPATATNAATETAINNVILGTPIAAGEVTVAVDTNNRRVTVTIAHSQSTYFADALGQSTTNISATGIAEASNSATGSGNVKPFFIPNTALYVSNNGSDTACTPCTTSPPNILIDPQTRQTTNWALTQIASGNNRFTVKPQNPGNALRPGQFYLIDFGGTQPGDLDEIISSFISDPRFCDTTYSVLTGNHVGPVNQGISTMIGCGQGNVDNRDIYVAPGQYRRPDGNIYSTSRALFTAPVWDVCNASFGGTPFCPTADFPGGTQPQLQIIGFALIFLEGFQNNANQAPSCNGNDAVGRVVGVWGCQGNGGGGGGGGIDPTETGPYAIPLRLVRVP